MTSLVYRRLHGAVYGLGRNSLCSLPDYSRPEIVESFNDVIRRLRIKKLSVAPTGLDAAEEHFVENYSRDWLRWAVDNIGWWFVKNLGVTQWFRWSYDDAYGSNSRRVLI